jgi:uncharacterized glyoxalase superfamily protein PhnB
VLPVAEVPKAAAYYRDQLGFTIRPSDPDGTGSSMVAERDAVEIHLVPKNQPPAVWILVDDVDQVADELMGRGARFESPVTSQEYGDRDFLVSDRDGYELGFWQPLPPDRHLPAIAQSPPDDPNDDATPF